ncbi:hypothetical protein ACTPEM_25135, partial [Clostridioides difficile]
GTVVGILIDKSMNDKKMIDALCESNINSVYNKIYTQNIINGGTASLAIPIMHLQSGLFEVNSKSIKASFNPKTSFISFPNS